MRPDEPAAQPVPGVGASEAASAGSLAAPNPMLETATQQEESRGMTAAGESLQAYLECPSDPFAFFAYVYFYHIESMRGTPGCCQNGQKFECPRIRLFRFSCC